MRVIAMNQYGSLSSSPTSDGMQDPRASGIPKRFIMFCCEWRGISFPDAAWEGPLLSTPRTQVQPALP
jgi:hypothetical protein